MNLSFAVAQIGHMSGALPSNVFPQTGQTYMSAVGRSFLAFDGVNGFLVEVSMDLLQLCLRSQSSVTAFLLPSALASSMNSGYIFLNS